MTPIHHIGRRVCEKRENNQKQSIEEKVTTIPQVLWKSITNPAHSLKHIRRTITVDETNYNPLQSDWVDDMLFEDDYTTTDETINED